MYQPINDRESDAFIARALGEAILTYGEPVIPVKKVLLRRSQKTEKARRYRIGEDFSLTECSDSTNGVFVIYLAVDSGHPNYFPLLGHECLHLLNPYITDWYMEGLATAFSEKICKDSGREWGDWERHFRRSRREPYALSYRMMQELQQAFPDEYPLLLKSTAANQTHANWLRIDIDAWLDLLDEERRGTALEIIEPYVKGLKRQVSQQYDFTIPAELK